MRLVYGFATMMMSAASEIPVFAMVIAIMVFAFSFGLTMDIPMKWVVGGLALFAIVNGYVVSAVAGVIVVFTLRSSGEQFLFAFAKWLEDTFPILRDVLGLHQPRYTGAERRKSERRGTRPSGTHSNQSRRQRDGTFGRGKRAAPQPRASGPETILGLSGNFTMKDLDNARRNLAKKFHPDLHRRASIKKQEKVAAQMRAINGAYETLKKQMQSTVNA